MLRFACDNDRKPTLRAWPRPAVRSIPRLRDAKRRTSSSEPIAMDRTCKFPLRRRAAAALSALGGRCRKGASWGIGGIYGKAI
jgi:hypothetical protein